MSAVTATSVEIKLTVAGSGVVEAAIASLHLDEGTPWEVFFAEDLGPADGVRAPLLEAGVVLRARRKRGEDHDTTVKLRPADPARLTGTWPDRIGGALEAQEDWTGSSHVLAVAATEDLDGPRIDTAREGGVGSLFSEAQQRFLTECSSVGALPTRLGLLGPVAVTRWKKVPGDGDLDLVAERWTLGDLDFLELSAVADPGEAQERQRRLLAFAAGVGLDLSGPPTTKTAAVLRRLVGDAAPSA